MNNNPWTPKFAPADDVNENWRAEGICVQVGPDLFDSENEEDQAAAKVLCAGCEVISTCLAWALANGSSYGVEGGLNGAERTAHPDFVFAGTAGSFAPLTEEDELDRFERGAARNDRRLATYARTSNQSLDFLIHPNDKAL